VKTSIKGTLMKCPFLLGIRHWFAVGVAGLVLISLASQAQEALELTFDGFPEQPPGSSYLVTEYYESGLWFTAIGGPAPGNGFGRTGVGAPELPHNGTVYLQAAVGNSLAFGFTDGTLFNLLSVDLAEYSTVVPDAVRVPFVGYRWDGSTVRVDFTTDGVIDGTGSLPDFETFRFGPEFSGLSRVEVPAWGWSLDNIVVSVPEPRGVILVAVAALAPWCFRKFSR
jgi:hypothetical protein